MITKHTIRQTIQQLGLSGENLCIHSSYRSFGKVENGPGTVIDAFLEEGCTVMAPTFSYSFMTGPDQENRPSQNAWDYSKIEKDSTGSAKVFNTDSNDIDKDMGIIPRLLVETKGRSRGRHPLDSFSALGPNSKQMTAGQTPRDVYAPFKMLTEKKGYIVLMGVGLERMTFIHHCEKEAGRKMFIRWALDADRNIMPVEIGGCSAGFNNLFDSVSSLATQATVGNSLWTVLPAADVFPVIRNAIAGQPEITRCPDAECVDCRDAVNGGPK